jgi:hypothetical protein
MNNGKNKTEENFLVSVKEKKNTVSTLSVTKIDTSTDIPEPLKTSPIRVS